MKMKAPHEASTEGCLKVPSQWRYIWSAMDSQYSHRENEPQNHPISVLRGTLRPIGPSSHGKGSFCIILKMESSSPKPPLVEGLLG